MYFSAVFRDQLSWEKNDVKRCSYFEYPIDDMINMDESKLKPNIRLNIRVLDKWILL